MYAREIAGYVLSVAVHITQSGNYLPGHDTYPVKISCNLHPCLCTEKDVVQNSLND